MVSQNVTVVNAQGFHMRPAMKFANEMTKYPCQVEILFNGSVTNGKSLMDIIAACMKRGAQIELRCDGPQETEALAAAVEMISTASTSKKQEGGGDDAAGHWRIPRLRDRPRTGRGGAGGGIYLAGRLRPGP